VFTGLSNPFVATRYHSLVVVADTVPAELEVTAPAVMGRRYRRHPIEGVQFHHEAAVGS
jgi:anthranilate/para-aminobenzoate synthase component II